jgi:hypothetical protein
LEGSRGRWSNRIDAQEVNATQQEARDLSGEGRRPLNRRVGWLLTSGQTAGVGGSRLLRHNPTALSSVSSNSSALAEPCLTCDHAPRCAQRTTSASAAGSISREATSATR